MLNYEPPRYIAIEGPIRVGKTSLARILAERLRARPVLDSEDNPFLGDFYQERAGAAFKAQMHFLMQRYQQLRGLASEDSRSTVVADYVFEKDKIFAYITLSDQELRLYDAYYDLLRQQVPTPDLVIYLQATPEVLRQRIARKKSPIETEIAGEYLEEVVKGYEHFFFHYKASKLLVVNTSEIDFVNNREDLEELLRRLTQPVVGTQYFLPLGSS
jgi:deoxyadenosine/deoxycytidine kinase